MLSPLRAPLLFSLVLLGWLLWPSAAHASVFVVDRTDDDASAGAQVCSSGVANDCSLRGAIIKASTTAAGAPHQISVPAGTYTLTLTGAESPATGDLDINGFGGLLVITGAGAGSTIIQAGPSRGAGIDRVMEVQGGVLNLQGVTVRFGTTAGSGAGVRVQNGTAAQIFNSHITDNISSSGGGGGIFSAGALTAAGVTLSGNQANTGGGLGMGDAPTGNMALTNVTISDNSSQSGAGAAFLSGATAVFNNATIAENRSAALAPGVIVTAGANFQPRNTIVARNVNGAGELNCATAGTATITSQGFNVLGDNSCGTPAGGDIPNVDPLLGPLQDNGGPTPTMALLPGSPALDAGDPDAPGGSNCAAADQRGVARALDGNHDGTARCDIGAYEGRMLRVDRIDDNAAATACTMAPNDCSLRGAITTLNADPLGGGIDLPTGTYTLTILGSDNANAAGDLDITGPIAITGTGASSTIIEAGPSPGTGIDRVFDIRGGGARGALTLSSVTVRHGRVSPSSGGGLLVAGARATLSSVHITLNTAHAGGGLRNDSGILTVSQSAVTGNSVDGDGGGVVSDESGRTTLTNVTISGNSAGSRAAGYGAFFGTIDRLNNVTLVGNQTTSTQSNAAGLFASGSIEILNSIVAGNTTGSGLRNCSGSVNSSGNNLSDTTDCPFENGAIGDQEGAAPILGPLQNNGGQTPTQLPGVGSPAIDTGNNSTCARVDQRGVARPIQGRHSGGAICDKGAIEAPPCPPVTLSVRNNAPNSLFLVVTAGGGDLRRMRSIPAKSSNIVVKVGPSTLPSDFDIGFSANVDAQPFTLQRQTNSGSGTLAFIVTDDCGDWETFAGGGPDAWTAAAGGNGVGSFSLDPVDGRVAVGDILPLRFTWTLPAPRVWRDLRSLELRLRDAQGVAWAVRWDEASDQFTVSEARSPAPVALIGPLTQGSGPTGPSVTLTLPLLAQEAGAGQTFTVEAQATDDAGTVDAFRSAGTLAILPKTVEDKPDQRKLTPEQRLQRRRTNAGNFDEIRTAGTVLGVDCATRPPVITIGNVDGEVRVVLRGSAAAECGRLRPGQNLEADGEKVTEHEFFADEVDAD